MAKTKKKGTKRIIAKKARGRKQTRQQIARVLKGPLRRRPRTPPLPGMEGIVADRELDALCSAIADNLHLVNEAAETLKGLKSNGLSALKRKNRTVYKGHGVEIVRVPGDEKLRARLVRTDAADAGEAAEEDQDLDNGAGEGDDSEETHFNA